MNRARVLLAEDHPSIAEQLRGLLDQEFDVISTVGDGQALVAAAELLRPDVIVTDIAMPGMDGLDAAQKVLERIPGVRIVFITIHDDPLLKERGLALGALGYVRKLEAAEQLVPAVRAALRSS
jgi:DNA-binding NarL/FixJ family response regulator